MMQELWNQKMEQYNVTFAKLAEELGISKQTLTKKVQGNMDWTYPEMMKLVKLFEITDPQSFFFQ